MTGSAAPAPDGDRDQLYLRQLLAGREFARHDGFARQMANYVYAIGDRATGETLLVDPAYAPAELLELVGEDGMHVVGALLTHYHADHAGGSIGGHRIVGVAELLELLDVPVHVQRAELAWAQEGTGLDAGAFAVHGDQDVIEVGSVALTLLHTPGHTPGSQSVLVGSGLVTGDTLFLEGCGRTDLPGGDGAALYDSIVRRIGSLPDATVVLPGHAYSQAPSAELAELRQTNPVLLPRAQAAWLAAFTA